jgi:hypothetical protein
MTQALIKIFQGLWALLRLQTVAITNTYTVDSGSYPDCVVLCNLGAAKTITLPTPTLGRVLIFRDIAGNAATYNITLSAASGNVEGGSTYAISDNKGGVILVSDGTNFWVAAGYTGTVI